MDIVKFLTNGPEGILEFVAALIFKAYASMWQSMATMWMRSSVDALIGDFNNPNSLVHRGQQTLSMIVYGLAILSVIVALCKIMLTQRYDGFQQIIAAIVRVLVAGGVAVIFTFAMLKAGDLAGPWLVEHLSGLTLESGISTMSKTPEEATAGAYSDIGALVLMMMLAPLTILVSIFNFVFVQFSYFVVVIVLIMLPMLAAMSTTEEGKNRFDRAAGWLVACGLYKFVGGIVWGVALALMTANSGAPNGDNGGAGVASMLTGFVACLAALLILPVLIKLAVPAMAGASGLNLAKVFGTVAAVTAGVAMGAATMGASLGATGAAGAASGAAGSGAATAGANTAAAGASQGAAATTGGSSAPAAEASNAGTQTGSGSSASSGSSSSEQNNISENTMPSHPDTGTDGYGQTPSAPTPAPEGGGNGAAAPVPVGGGGTGFGGMGPGGTGQQLGYAFNQLHNDGANELESALGEGEKL